MSPNIGEFDASEIEPSQPREVLPPEWFAVQLVESDFRESKSSDGQYILLTWELSESHHPEYKGRKVWDRLNLWNANPTAVEIAQRTLSAICRASGKMRITDTDELLGIPVAVKLKVKPADGQYEARNEVAGYDSVEARFGKPGAPSNPQRAPAKEGAARRPWDK